MNRRNLLSAGPALIVLTGAGAGLDAVAATPLEGAGTAPSSCPDAALIALCATFHRQHAEAYDEANLDWEAACAAKYRTFDEIGNLTATTNAGHRAKAAVAVVMLAENHDDGTIVDPEALFALNLLSDWLGRPRV